jgi:hypothetical protein
MNSVEENLQFKWELSYKTSTGIFLTETYNEYDDLLIYTDSDS